MTLAELQNKVASLGSILGIWAHPDDEIFMSAGLMALAVQNGQAVTCITATRGEKGVQDEARWPAEQLGEIRTKELDEAYEILGVTRHHWLDFPDGGCIDADQTAAIERISALVEKYRPDTIITFPPNGSTGHPDHITVSRWAGAAADNCQTKDITVLFSADIKEEFDKYWRALDEQFDIYFNLDMPRLVPEASCDLLLKLTPDLSRRKCDALCAMPSQSEAMVLATGKDRFCRVLSTEGFIDRRRTDISWPPA